MRYGFTLAELIVAIVLLTIGVGALASTAAYSIYGSAASRRTERAAMLARTRLELLRLRPCVSGSDVVAHDGLTERWTVTATPRGAIAVVAITYRERSRAAEQRYESRFPC